MFDKSLLQQVPHSEITWCYHTVWHKGILSGVCRYAGETYWTECFQQGIDDGERYYGLFRLSEGEWCKLRVVDGWMPDVWGRIPVAWFMERTDVNETQ